MAITVEIQEAQPVAYPAIENLGVDTSVAWQRIEQWIKHRWAERDVTFIVEGPGDWVPPLQPFSTLTIEVWYDNEWVSAVVAPTPRGGYQLDQIGPFRFTGIAGTDDAPPASVVTAVTRLVQYNQTVSAGSGAIRGFKIDDLDVELTSPNAVARALQLSGAADLLRPYRNLGAN